MYTPDGHVTCIMYFLYLFHTQREQLGVEPTIVELFSRTNKIHDKEDGPQVDKNHKKHMYIFVLSGLIILSTYSKPPSILKGYLNDNLQDQSQPFQNPNELW